MFIKFIFTFARNEWWRHFPFLPIPSWRYIKFRQVTMYGHKGIKLIPKTIKDFPQFYRAWKKHMYINRR